MKFPVFCHSDIKFFVFLSVEFFHITIAFSWLLFQCIWFNWQEISPKFFLLHSKYIFVKEYFNRGVIYTADYNDHYHLFWDLFMSIMLCMYFLTFAWICFIWWVFDVLCVCGSRFYDYKLWICWMTHFPCEQVR